MADGNIPKRDFAAELAQEMAQDDFPMLLKRFNDSSCTEDAYAVATWMYSRFPQESKQLLPLVKDEQLTFDGKSDAHATTGEWASAITAAKFMRGNATLDRIATANESQVHDSAKKIYDEHHKKPSVSPAKPNTSNVQR